MPCRRPGRHPGRTQFSWSGYHRQMVSGKSAPGHPRSAGCPRTDQDPRGRLRYSLLSGQASSPHNHELNHSRPCKNARKTASGCDRRNHPHNRSPIAPGRPSDCHQSQGSRNRFYEWLCRRSGHCLEPPHPMTASDCNHQSAEHPGSGYCDASFRTGRSW